jgi:hypothetical protein
MVCGIFCVLPEATTCKSLKAWKQGKATPTSRGIEHIKLRNIFSVMTDFTLLFMLMG